MYYGEEVKTIAVIGWKNGGKTTLVSNLVNYFSSNIDVNVGVIKHTMVLILINQTQIVIKLENLVHLKRQLFQKKISLY